MTIKNSKVLLKLFCLLVFIPFSGNSKAEGTSDSLKVKKIKRYIRPNIYYNSFTTPEKEIHNRLLKSYKFNQRNLGFYFPLFTNTWIQKDSVKVNTFHLLLAGNLQSSRPTFTGIDYQGQLIKITMALRAIYSKGKNVWFFNFSPFIAQDDKNIHDPTVRFSAGFLFNRTVSKNFSYRLGIERTYIFGNRLHLPVIGFRIGRMDRFNINIQLPRNVSLNFPMGRKVYFNIFARPNGGIYAISNPNNLFPNFGKQITFSRQDITTGFQLNIRASNSFSFFISSGITHNRKIFILDRVKDKGSKKIDIREAVSPGGFLSLGLNIQLGKAKQVYNNYVMYDVFNMNNLYTPGNPQNLSIPVNPEKYKAEEINKIKYKDIEDLMTEE
jgi:hypothetical protein